MKTVVGLFKDIRSAEHALDELAAAGLNPHDIGILSSPHACATVIPPTPMTEVELPGVGRMEINRPMLRLLGAPDLLADGAALRQALERAGLSAEAAEWCIEGIKRGGTLEAVAVDEGMAAEALAVMCRHSGTSDGLERWTEPAAPATSDTGGRWKRLRMAIRGRRGGSRRRRAGSGRAGRRRNRTDRRARRSCRPRARCGGS